MTPKTITYYNFIEDLQPEILKNLNELLAADGIEPLDNLHGDSFKDGKWVSVTESKDYRNYWHLYLDLWGEHVRNDSFDEVWFPHVDNEDEWEYLYETALEFGQQIHRPTTDPTWPKHLVTAVRKMIADHDLVKDQDGECILIKWSW